MTPAPVAIVAPATLPLDFERLADAIRAVESRPGHMSGAHGERGPWQFKAESWAEDAEGLSFALAYDPITSRGVAVRRLKRLRSMLLERHLDATPYTLALCWREGPTGVILGKWANKDVRDYAVRIENIYTYR